MADEDKKIDDYEVERDTVTLTLDDDEVVVCDVVAVFPAPKGDYIAVQKQGIDDAPVWLYRYSENPNDPDDVTLDSIDSEEEFQEVAEAFDDYMYEDDFDDIEVDEDE